jgi:hypothetical protein
LSSFRFVCRPWVITPFNPKVVAPRFGIANVQVLHLVLLEQARNERFDFAVVDVFFRDHTTSVPVGNHRQPVAAKVCRETCGVGKSFAGILVNEDRPR